MLNLKLLLLQILCNTDLEPFQLKIINNNSFLVWCHQHFCIIVYPVLNNSFVYVCEMLVHHNAVLPLSV